MLAHQLVSGKYFPLKITDTCGKALDILNEYDIAHLPVIDNNKHLGYIAVSDLLDQDESYPIEPYINRTVVSKVYQNQHLYEVIQVFSEIAASCLSVVDEDDNFTGIITAKELLAQVAGISSFSQPGSIITIEVPAINYTLSEISRIVEYNDAKILSLYVSATPDAPSRLQITLKLNRIDIKAVVAAFERYGYQIIASFSGNTDAEDFKSRYQSLMKYLDI